MTIYREESGMYKIGDRVIYGIHGVCVVADQEERMVDGMKRGYLVLEPIKQDGSRYLIPQNNSAAMGKLRRMLSEQELTELLDKQRDSETVWNRDENQRKQMYRELIGSGDREKLIQTVRALYIHKAAQAISGRKFHLCDENFLRDAEKLLASEISVVLNMTDEDAKQFLRKKLHG